jgi:hypothetical protein
MRAAHAQRRCNATLMTIARHDRFAPRTRARITPAVDLGILP